MLENNLNSTSERADLEQGSFSILSKKITEEVFRNNNRIIIILIIS